MNYVIPRSTAWLLLGVTAVASAYIGAVIAICVMAVSS